MASNAQRADWRQRCREILATHIETQLGIIVSPGEVRLQPDDNDHYSWSWLPERARLFSKQISKHSTGAYMELCREVGRSFEAIRRGEFSDQDPKYVGGFDSMSFQDKIKLSESTNNRLENELLQCREEVTTHQDAQRSLFQEAQILRSELKVAVEHIALLTQHNLSLEKRACKLKTQVLTAKKEVGTVVKTLRKLNSLRPV